ncbi:ATP-binding protein [Pelagibius marinus]|uniref:ATP-binding protein n=1 Tax=Pelagibius marinus TaxID=2762760 RepID=UPI00187316D5|nr:ATP-binding protein [Pelagibius marinus]
MDERSLLLGLLHLAVRDAPADSPLAKALLAWCRDRAHVLGLPVAPEKAEESEEDTKKRPRLWLRRKPEQKPEEKPAPPAEAWAELARDIAAARTAAPAKPSPVLVLTARLAALLALDAAETRLLQTVVACDRLRHCSALCHLLERHGAETPPLLLELAGIESLEALRQTKSVQLNLIDLSIGRHDTTPTLRAMHCVHRLLNRAPMNDEAMIECLVGTAAPARLALSDFASRGEELSLLHRLLRGALSDRAEGINILLYGPPGTGKTELAKALAAAAGARLYAVGETDGYGDEPERWERVDALKLAQQLLAQRRDAVLLFDEMEDLIGDAYRNTDNRISRRPGSKVFVNRLFESNAVPTIWTSNSIENIDPAYLRRMTYVMKMDLPSPQARKVILGRIARDEGLELSPGAIGRLAETASESTAVARNALRTARLLQGGEEETSQVLESLVTGLRYGRRLPPGGGAERDLDLGLYQSDISIAALFDRLSAAGAPADFSLLLTGPPGTGKTALARHLARQLDRPLLVKRASDLLSKWIGETEKLIAESFTEAAESGSILLFDEVDSLLSDRGRAEKTWEVSQVNELLTWMDSHPFPFVAATNHAARLDSAALRRFVFKVKLEALGPAAAARAFEVFFDRPAPPRLAEIAGLTPGDFAVVARQLRFQEDAASPEAIVGLLAKEAAAKPGTPGRIGFRPQPRQNA